MIQTSDELSCQELVELVTDYLEGKLSPTDRARFDAHLVGCRGCTAYVDQMRKTIIATHHLSEESIAPEAKTTLLAIFRNWKNEQK